MDEFKKLMSILSEIDVSKKDFNFICESDYVISIDSTGTQQTPKGTVACYRVKLSDNNAFNIKVSSK